MFAIIRILIGSYFLAAGTGLILEPSSRTFFDGVLPADISAVTTTLYLFVTAFMIMVGKAVRPAALMLALYIFWSAFVTFELGISAEGLTSFWRDMALLGAVLLVAVTEPGGSDSFRLWRRGVAPRRIVPQEASTPATHRLPREKPNAEPVYADASMIKLSEVIFDDDAKDAKDDRDNNIFGDLWEPQMLMTSTVRDT